MALENEFEQRLLQQQIALKSKMIDAINQACNDIANYLARYSRKFPDDYKSRITYINRMGIKKQLMAQLKELVREMDQLTHDGAKQSWALSIQKNNILTKSFITGITLPVALTKSMFANNEHVLISYLENASKISERVLEYTGLYQEQIESYLAAGIVQGKGAREIASELKSIANNPIAEFRAMKKAFPDAGLKMPKPGTGVYNSIYKNFLRIARTETNIAYRLSNYEKRKQLPFIIGFEVHLSAAHPKFDICDIMEGSYPVEFVFCGWHPNCLCYEISILATKDEFKQWVKNGMDGDIIKGGRTITRIPVSAERYVLTHKDKFANQYFYRDNFDNGKPLAIIGGARKDIRPYQIIPTEPKIVARNVSRIRK